jgi:elongation factor G
MTGGQGSFSMEFSKYDAVPGHVAKAIVEHAGVKHDEEDED